MMRLKIWRLADSSLHFYSQPLKSCMNLVNRKNMRKKITGEPTTCNYEKTVSTVLTVFVMYRYVIYLKYI